MRQRLAFEVADAELEDGVLAVLGLDGLIVWAICASPWPG